MSISRPDGSSVTCLHLRAPVDQQRLQTEVVGALSGSQKPIVSTLPQALPVTSLSVGEKYLLRGRALLSASSEVWSVQLASVSMRSVEQPSTERAVFGAKDSLVEDLDQNIALIRSHLRDPSLEVERLTIGTRTETDIAVVSLAAAVDAKMLDDVVSRLRRYAPERLGFVSALLSPLFEIAWSPFLRADFTSHGSGQRARRARISAWSACAEKSDLVARRMISPEVADIEHRLMPYCSKSVTVRSVSSYPLSAARLCKCSSCQPLA